MIDQPTRDMLNELKMPELEEIVMNQGKVPQFAAMPFDQRLQFAIADLYSIKSNHRQKLLLKRSNVRYPNVAFSDIDYLPDRKLDRNFIAQISTGNFMEHATGLVIYGATGSGKTFVASCIGHMACSKLKRTLFIRQTDLLTDYECLETLLQKRKYLRKMTNYDILVVDEWLGNVPTEPQLSFLFELVKKRNEVKSTIFCSQFNPKDWYVRLGESTKSESLLNRILSGVCRLDCGNYNIREYYYADLGWCSTEFLHRCCTVHHRCNYGRIFRKLRMNLRRRKEKSEPAYARIKA